VEFAVLGCGNKQWRATFQKVPQLLFDRMQALGAKALLPFAGCDADGDFDASAESFFGSVWSLLSARGLPLEKEALSQLRQRTPRMPILWKW
jgi:cytochrome P450/NADPH-cytochrome P450 reductase